MWRSARAPACKQLSRLVICAGLQSDLLATEAGDETAPEIIPFRGEYLRLRLHARDRVRHLIYPVPDPAYPFLGVHLTPRIDGEVDIGPNAVLALAREGYRRRDVSGDQLSRLARSAAFRRLARQNWRAGCARCAGQCRGRRSSPRPAPTCPGWARRRDGRPGRSARPGRDPDGSLVDDFRIDRIGPVTTVRNAPSPAATASLAIAERIVAELSDQRERLGVLRLCVAKVVMSTGARGGEVEVRRAAVRIHSWPPQKLS